MAAQSWSISTTSFQVDRGSVGQFLTCIMPKVVYKKRATKPVSQICQISQDITDPLHGHDDVEEVRVMWQCRELWEPMGLIIDDIKENST